MQTTPRPPTHGLRPMTGRDPDQQHRPATQLELLYDLVFVISFGVAGNEFAQLIAQGYWQDGLLAFAFGMFAVIWAWINFSWFASAYDTDDWLYRILVTVQMVGVVILALGLPAMFASIHADGPVNATAMVVGYVIVRVPLFVLWLRAARHSAGATFAPNTYAGTILVAQIGWCVLLLFDLSGLVFVFAATPLFLIEVTGPLVAERERGGTTWHPHHIAERYGLLAIISFGEILVGTVAALQSVIAAQGWSMDVALLAVFGVALTVGLWWIYFSFPSGELLAQRCDRAFLWGAGHFVT